MQNKLHRIIDVNLNRSREALRVCEDIARFVLNDKALTGSLKNTRHKISKIQIGNVAEARSVKTDIGKKSSFDKGKPKNLTLLFYNNIHRAEESTRSLEEFSKLTTPDLSAKFKSLRFAIYSIEKKAMKKLKSL